MNITVNDNRGEGVGWYSPFRENNEVEPGNIASQKWDLEGFSLNGDLLTIQGGYNFTTSVGYDGFRPGDLFFDVNGGGYDFVATIGSADSTYDVYTIGETFGVYYAENDTSSPWRRKDGGLRIGEDLPVAYSSFVDSEGTHYVANLELNWLYDRISYGDVVKLHYTMECGNDMLAGEFRNDVPESHHVGLLIPLVVALMYLFRRR